VFVLIDPTTATPLFAQIAESIATQSFAAGRASRKVCKRARRDTAPVSKAAASPDPNMPRSARSDDSAVITSSTASSELIASAPDPNAAARPIWLGQDQRRRTGDRAIRPGRTTAAEQDPGYGRRKPTPTAVETRDQSAPLQIPASRIRGSHRSRRRLEHAHEPPLPPRPHPAPAQLRTRSLATLPGADTPRPGTCAGVPQALPRSRTQSEGSRRK
jgi:hypothetical protein